LTRLVSALLIATAVAGPLHAHETWLLPAAFSARPGESVLVELTSGMDFPASDTAIKAERIAAARVRMAGRFTELNDFQAKPTALRIPVSLPCEGLATVCVDLRPRSFELTDAQVAEYLNEIGANESLRSTWRALKGREPWRETYTKHAKTFVAVGHMAGDSSWREAAGANLELVPQTNPTNARTGGRFSCKLLRRGKPLADQSVGLIIEGIKGRVFQSTDSGGCVTFKADRPGKALVFTVDLRRAASGTGWESEFATLTLEIKPDN
jgi:uncharacterized GH25 family protein